MAKSLGWLSVGVVIVGLLVASGGAWLTAKAVIIDEATASELGATKWNGNDALKTALMDQSRAASKGLVLIMIGSALQVVGVALQAVAALTG